MNKIICTTSFLTLFLPTVLFAENGIFITGNNWQQLTEDMKSGYVMGVIDAYSIANHARSGDKLFITNCIPPSTNSIQLTKVVDKYVTNNPEHLHINMDAIVAMVLSQAFPCKK